MQPFSYPPAPHVRLHGPSGYADYESYRPWLRDDFLFRCVYCLKREQWGLVRGTYHIDHFVPQVSAPGLVLNYENLLYACGSCNSAKKARDVPDPCGCMLEGTVTVNDDGTIQPSTEDTAQLIRVLGLDSPEYNHFRRLWIDILALAAKADPPLYKNLMSYPEALPDLSGLKPPGGNSRLEGVENSCHALRSRGELSEIY